MEEQQVGEYPAVDDLKCKQEIKNILSPPSSSSNSPSHEFSFTISLHSSSTTPTTTTNVAASSHKTISPHAIDLSPADDIFFHGHLLPLHLLSHFPVSPRSSITSLDNFTLPIKELIEHQSPTAIIKHQKKPISKSKTFSLFGLKSWKKECHQDSIQKQENEQDQEQSPKEKTKRKQRYDISNMLKRYVKMVRPMFLYKGRRESNGKLHKHAYSLSGNLSLRHTKQELVRGRRGEFSAPASLRTSPSNSGLLVNYNEHSQSSTNDSTMEELQSAIQSAIAHCKKSIAVQDNPK